MLQPIEWIERSGKVKTSPKGMWRKLGYLFAIMGLVGAFGMTWMLR